MGTSVPPKELLLKYCFLRVAKGLGATINEQKRKVYLKTTWFQTAELRMSREMVPQCYWEHQNLWVFVSLYYIRQVRVPDTHRGTSMVWGLCAEIQSLPLAHIGWET